MVKIQLKNAWSKPTDKGIDRAQSKMGVVLPAAYVQFLKRYNGGQPVPGRFEIPGILSRTVALFYGIGGPTEQDISNCHKRHWNFVSARFSSEERDKYSGLLSIAEDEDGNPLFIGSLGATEGRVFYLDKKKKENSLTEIARTLDEFLSSFQAAVSGEYEEDEEEDGAEGEEDDDEEAAHEEEEDDEGGRKGKRHGHMLRGRRQAKRYGDDDDDSEDVGDEDDEE